MIKETAYDPQKLQNFCAEVLCSLNLPEVDAHLVAQSLVEANLRGVDSHGIVRLLTYAKRLSKSLVNPNPTINIIKETTATALIDGNNGMGQVIAVRGMNIAIEKAKKNGVGVVGIRNSSHFGAAAYFTQIALRENMIGIALSNASSSMAPHGSKIPYLGTNPLSIAIPTKNELPILLDMATSVNARGKIVLALKKEKPIEYGVAMDSQGNITTDPEKALAGALLPFGREKGSGIAIMVEILSSVLTGAAYGPNLVDLSSNFEDKQNVGHFLCAINLDAFIGMDNFMRVSDSIVREIKELPLANGFEEIFLPGEIEYKNYKKNQAEGIILPQKVVEELKELADLLRVNWVTRCYNHSDN